MRQLAKSSLRVTQDKVLEVVDRLFEKKSSLIVIEDKQISKSIGNLDVIFGKTARNTFKKGERKKGI